MKIRMLKTAAGPEVNLVGGQVVTVDDETGQAYVDAGAAVCLDEPKVVAKKATKKAAEPSGDGEKGKEGE